MDGQYKAVGETPHTVEVGVTSVYEIRDLHFVLLGRVHSGFPK
jgi:hypothetical protein